MTEPNFEPLIAAHDFVSSRLIYFFNNDEFTEAGFVMNEFELYALFIVTIALIQDNPNPDESVAMLEQFHHTIVEKIVVRIEDTQPDEVSEEQHDALEEKILAIFQERLRLYFQTFQKQKANDVQAFLPLSAILMEHGVQNIDDPDVVNRFAPFSYELFTETVTLLQKSFEIKAMDNKVS
jgi:hypothetical protein